VIVAASRLVAKLLLRRIAVGSLVVVDSGVRQRFGTGAPTATVEIRSRRVWPMLMRGSRGLAEAYERELMDSPDLVALIRLAALNATGLDRTRARFAPVLGPLRALGSLGRRSTPARRRRDIAAHYDLGNELFRRMLDPTLSYSCAVFDHGHETLEEAQVAKLELVCDKLELAPGDRVLEIGTGWGAFALHASSAPGSKTGSRC
jgi:cyclopropane-fatty-acyl-phospholipid synthase